MCKECGCGGNSENTRIKFKAVGYNEENSKAVEHSLLGLPGVLYVHIHTHDGETTIDYNPKKTKLMEILKIFEDNKVEANL